MRQRHVIAGGVCVGLATAVIFGAVATPEPVQIAWEAAVRRVRGGYTIADRLAEFGQAAQARLQSGFDAASVAFPPAETTWLAFKDRRVLEVHARSSGTDWRLVRSYPILGASGGPGPKLREGDRQVPEGIYWIELLNPNSLYHVSLRLDYPNAFDRRMAAREGRTDPGGDIMIHGKSASVGCLAMGDEAAEELFALAAAVGIENVTVVIAPTDLRANEAYRAPGSAPAWTADLYETIRNRLELFPSGTKERR